MFKEDLKQARTRLGISGREAAKRIGISSAYYSQLETGKREKPKGELLARMETVLQAAFTTSAPLASASNSASGCKQCVSELAALQSRMSHVEQLLVEVLAKLSSK